MAKVFISYSREDRAFVEQLATRLEHQGHTVWWDRRLNVDHVPFAQQIQTELDASSAVVVVWSKTSVLSQWVWDEAERARKSNKLIAVGIDDSAPPPPFGAFEVAKFSGWDGAASGSEWKRVCDSIARRSDEHSPEASYDRLLKSTDHVVWAVGSPGAGKSATISHCLRFLSQSPHHATIIEEAALAHHQGDKKRAHSLLLSWSEDWQKDRFPRRTPVGHPFEISTRVCPLTKKFRPQRIRWVECSGEDFKSVYSVDRTSALAPSLDRYLTNHDGSLSLLLCMNGDFWDHQLDDLLLSEFLVLARSRSDWTPREGFATALVITDPTAAKRKLGTSSLRPEDFAARFLPKTTALLRQDKNAARFSFFLGDRDERRESNGFSNPSFDDASRLVRWIDRASPAPSWMFWR